MKNKLIQFIPAIVALVFVGFRYFSQWCIGEGHVCFRTFLDSTYLRTIYPLFSFSIFFLPVVIILAFVPRHAFNAWLKFSVWALPLASIYIAMTPVWDSSWLPFARDDAARLAGEVFSGVSLILIIWKIIALRRKSGRV